MNYYFLAATEAGAQVEISTDSELYSAIKWITPKILKADLEPYVIKIKWDSVRVERDELLKSTDWAILPDSPLTQTKKDEYIAYRADLRNITNQADPLNVIWPVKPA